MHRSRSSNRRRPPAVVAAVILVCGCFAATAAATFSSSAGSNQLSIMNVGSTGSTAMNTPGWIPVVGATRTVHVPSGGAVINARFTAESNCTGLAGSSCLAKIKATALQLNPKIASPPFVFDSRAGAAHRGSLGIERSITLAAGTYAVNVRMNVSPNASFSVKNWHLAVEMSAP
jgi:hypothetical protein